MAIATPDAPAPLPVPPTGPGANPHSERNAMARLRARREPAPDQAPAEPQAQTRAERGPDGKFKPRVVEDRATESEQALDDAQPNAQVEGAEAPQTAEDVAEVATLKDLAEHLGVDPADLYNVRIPVEVDGSTQEITLGEWKDSYRATQKVTRQEQELAQQKQAFDNWQKQQQETLARAQAQAGAVIEAMRNQYTADFQAVDWQSLRYTDPAEFAAKKAEFDMRHQAIENVVRQAAQEFETRKASEGAERDKHRLERLKREQQALLSKIPEWKDAKTAEVEQAKVLDYVMSLGFTEQELQEMGDNNPLYDHRIVVMARKALRFEDGAKAAAQARRATVKIGTKTLQPGARANGSNSARATEQKLRTDLKKSGDQRDALALLRHLRNKPKR